jgi:hypothetical protein
MLVPLQLDSGMLSDGSLALLHGRIAVSAPPTQPAFLKATHRSQKIPPWCSVSASCGCQMGGAGKVVHGACIYQRGAASKIIKLGLCSSEWDQTWNAESWLQALDHNGEFFQIHASNLHIR